METFQTDTDSWRLIHTDTDISVCYRSFLILNRYYLKNRYHTFIPIPISPIPILIPILGVCFIQIPIPIQLFFPYRYRYWLSVWLYRLIPGIRRTLNSTARWLTILVFIPFINALNTLHFQRIIYREVYQVIVLNMSPTWLKSFRLNQIWNIFLAHRRIVINMI